jgi:hypothetical protein
MVAHFTLRQKAPYEVRLICSRREISLLVSPFLANALIWGMYFVMLGGGP